MTNTEHRTLTTADNNISFERGHSDNSDKNPHQHNRPDTSSNFPSNDNVDDILPTNFSFDQRSVPRSKTFSSHHQSSQTVPNSSPTWKLNTTATATTSPPADQQKCPSSPKKENQHMEHIHKQSESRQTQGPPTKYRKVTTSTSEQVVEINKNDETRQKLDSDNEDRNKSGTRENFNINNPICPKVTFSSITPHSELDELNSALTFDNGDMDVHERLATDEELSLDFDESDMFMFAHNPATEAAVLPSACGGQFDDGKIQTFEDTDDEEVPASSGCERKTWKRNMSTDIEMDSVTLTEQHENSGLELELGLNLSDEAVLNTNDSEEGLYDDVGLLPHHDEGNLFLTESSPITDKRINNITTVNTVNVTSEAKHEPTEEKTIKEGEDRKWKHEYGQALEHVTSENDIVISMEEFQTCVENNNCQGGILISQPSSSDQKKQETLQRGPTFATNTFVRNNNDVMSEVYRGKHDEKLEGNGNKVTTTKSSIVIKEDDIFEDGNELISTAENEPVVNKAPDNTRVNVLLNNNITSSMTSSSTLVDAFNSANLSDGNPSNPSRLNADSSSNVLPYGMWSSSHHPNSAHQPKKVNDVFEPTTPEPFMTQLMHGRTPPSAKTSISHPPLPHSEPPTFHLHPHSQKQQRLTHVNKVCVNDLSLLDNIFNATTPITPFQSRNHNNSTPATSTLTTGTKNSTPAPSQYLSNFNFQHDFQHHQNHTPTVHMDIATKNRHQLAARRQARRAVRQAVRNNGKKNMTKNNRFRSNDLRPLFDEVNVSSASASVSAGASISTRDVMENMEPDTHGNVHHTLQNRFGNAGERGRTVTSVGQHLQLNRENGVNDNTNHSHMTTDANTVLTTGRVEKPGAVPYKRGGNRNVSLFRLISKLKSIYS